MNTSQHATADDPQELVRLNPPSHTRIHSSFANCVAVPITLIQDTRLSWAARGFGAYLYSLRHRRFSIDLCPVESSAFDELVAAGYLRWDDEIESFGLTNG